MKKLLVLTFALVCLTSGCTKKYNSVEDYAQYMKSVRELHKSYTLEFESLSWIADGYYRMYIKDNLWKYNQSANNGKSYMRTVMYDGSDIVGYGEHSKWATILASPATDSDKDLYNKMHNVAYKLFNWDKPSSLCNIDNSEPVFVNNKAKMNGFDCRLIRYSDSYEVCVNDKLGIAVYLKAVLGGDTSKETVLNLKKADTKELPNSTFYLPKDKQKISLEELLQEMSKGNF